MTPFRPPCSADLDCPVCRDRLEDALTKAEAGLRRSLVVGLLLMATGVMLVAVALWLVFTWWGR